MLFSNSLIAHHRSFSSYLCRLNRSIETLGSKWDQAQAQQQTELRAAEHEVSNAVERQSEAESRAMAIEAQAEQLQQRLEATESERQRFEEELTTSRQHEAALAATVGGLEAKLEAKEDELSTAAQEAATSSAQIRALQDERIQLERRVAAAVRCVQKSTVPQPSVMQPVRSFKIILQLCSHS